MQTPMLNLSDKEKMPMERFALEYIKHEPLLQISSYINRRERRQAYARMSVALKVRWIKVQSLVSHFRKAFYSCMLDLARSENPQESLRQAPLWMQQVEVKLKMLPKAIEETCLRRTEGYGGMQSAAGALRMMVAYCQLHRALCSRELYRDLRRALRCRGSNADLHAIWVRAQRVCVQQVLALGRAGDAPQLAPDGAARRVADLVLLYTDLDTYRLLNEDSALAGAERGALALLLALVRRHGAEGPRPPARPAACAWTRVYCDYVATGKKTSLVVLQRRWHELKLQARERVLACWRTTPPPPEGGHPPRPALLHVQLVQSFPHVVTEPVVSWSRLVAESLIYTAPLSENASSDKSDVDDMATSDKSDAEDAAASENLKGKPPDLTVDKGASTDVADDDVQLIEKPIDTVDVDSASDTEDKLVIDEPTSKLAKTVTVKSETNVTDDAPVVDEETVPDVNTNDNSNVNSIEQNATDTVCNPIKIATDESINTLYKPDDVDQNVNTLDNQEKVLENVENNVQSTSSGIKETDTEQTLAILQSLDTNSIRKKIVFDSDSDEDMFEKKHDVNNDDVDAGNETQSVGNVLSRLVFTDDDSDTGSENICPKKTGNVNIEAGATVGNAISNIAATKFVNTDNKTGIDDSIHEKPIYRGWDKGISNYDTDLNKDGPNIDVIPTLTNDTIRGSDGQTILFLKIKGNDVPVAVARDLFPDININKDSVAMSEDESNFDPKLVMDARVHLLRLHDTDQWKKYNINDKYINIHKLQTVHGTEQYVAHKQTTQTNIKRNKQYIDLSKFDIESVETTSESSSDEMPLLKVKSRKQSAAAGVMKLPPDLDKMFNESELWKTWKEDRIAKRVQLPDIEEVRRVNSNILTAQVAPITASTQEPEPVVTVCEDVEPEELPSQQELQPILDKLMGELQPQEDGPSVEQQCAHSALSGAKVDGKCLRCLGLSGWVAPSAEAADLRRQLRKVLKAATPGSCTERSSKKSTKTTKSSKQPNTKQPNTNQPNTKQPNTKQPITKQPNTNQPNTKQPNTKQPNTKQPNTKQPNTNQPNTKQPNTKQPNTNQPNTNQLNTNQPNTKQPNTDQQSTNQQSTNQQSTNQQSTNQPNTKQPNTKQTHTKQPNTKQPNTKQPNTKKKRKVPKEPLESRFEPEEEPTALDAMAEWERQKTMHTKFFHINASTSKKRKTAPSERDDNTPPSQAAGPKSARPSLILKHLLRDIDIIKSKQAAMELERDTAVMTATAEAEWNRQKSLHGFFSSSPLYRMQPTLNPAPKPTSGPTLKLTSEQIIKPTSEHIIKPTSEQIIKPTSETTVKPTSGLKLKPMSELVFNSKSGLTPTPRSGMVLQPASEGGDTSTKEKASPVSFMGQESSRVAAAAMAEWERQKSVHRRFFTLNTSSNKPRIRNTGSTPQTDNLNPASRSNWHTIVDGTNHAESLKRPADAAEQSSKRAKIAMVAPDTNTTKRQRDPMNIIKVINIRVPKSSIGNVQGGRNSLFKPIQVSSTVAGATAMTGSWPANNGVLPSGAQQGNFNAGNNNATEDENGKIDDDVVLIKDQEDSIIIDDDSNDAVVELDILAKDTNTVQLGTPCAYLVKSNTATSINVPKDNASMQLNPNTAMQGAVNFTSKDTDVKATSKVNDLSSTKIVTLVRGFGNSGIVTKCISNQSEPNQATTQIIDLSIDDDDDDVVNNSVNIDHNLSVHQVLVAPSCMRERTEVTASADNSGVVKLGRGEAMPVHKVTVNSSNITLNSSEATASGSGIVESGKDEAIPDPAVIVDASLVSLKPSELELESGEVTPVNEDSVDNMQNPTESRTDKALPVHKVAVSSDSFPTLSEGAASSTCNGVAKLDSNEVILAPEVTVDPVKITEPTEVTPPGSVLTELGKGETMLVTEVNVDSDNIQKPDETTESDNGIDDIGKPDIMTVHEVPLISTNCMSFESSKVSAPSECVDKLGKGLCMLVHKVTTEPDIIKKPSEVTASASDTALGKGEPMHNDEATADINRVSLERNSLEPHPIIALGWLN